jgi:head-tail adaptor
MAKSVTAGEMRTRVTVQKQAVTVDADGVGTKTWSAAISGYLKCKWVYAHGKEADENMRLNLGQTATITMRYTPLIDQRCRIFHEADAQIDANAWEVVSVNDPEDRHAFIEIVLKKAVMA